MPYAKIRISDGSGEDTHTKIVYSPSELKDTENYLRGLGYREGQGSYSYEIY